MHKIDINRTSKVTQSPGNEVQGHGQKCNKNVLALNYERKIGSW